MSSESSRPNVEPIYAKFIHEWSVVEHAKAALQKTVGEYTWSQNGNSEKNPTLYIEFVILASWIGNRYNYNHQAGYMMLCRILNASSNKYVSYPEFD